jgi:CheY-like chemotaxis protein
MDQRSGYLLVVDDAPNILELLETTLYFKGGYRVATAHNGEEALEVIRRERPILVISDILMPRMDGFNFVHQLRLTPEFRDIPVVFLSATYVAPEDKIFAILIGATRFLEKPIDIDLLMQTISELLTQAPPVVSEPINELEFYLGYSQRIKIKLEQKNKQVMRIKRILPTISGDEEKVFMASLLAAIEERDEIQLHLDQVDARIEISNKSNSEELGSGD